LERGLGGEVVILERGLGGEVVILERGRGGEVVIRKRGLGGEVVIRERGSGGEVRTPTTKAVGSEIVAKYQPTALVVGDAKKRGYPDFKDCLVLSINKPTKEILRL